MQSPLDMEFDNSHDSGFCSDIDFGSGGFYTQIFADTPWPTEQSPSTMCSPEKFDSAEWPTEQSPSMMCSPEKFDSAEWLAEPSLSTMCSPLEFEFPMWPRIDLPDTYSSLPHHSDILTSPDTNHSKPTISLSTPTKSSQVSDISTSLSTLPKAKVDDFLKSPHTNRSKPTISLSTPTKSCQVSDISMSRPTNHSTPMIFMPDLLQPRYTNKSIPLIPILPTSASPFFRLPDTNHSEPTMLLSTPSTSCQVDDFFKSTVTNHSKPTISLSTPPKSSQCVILKVVKVLPKTAMASVIPDLNGRAGPKVARVPFKPKKNLVLILKDPTNGNRPSIANENEHFRLQKKDGTSMNVFSKTATRNKPAQIPIKVVNVISSKENTLQKWPVLGTAPLIVRHTDPAVHTTEIETTARPESGLEMVQEPDHGFGLDPVFTVNSDADTDTDTYDSTRLTEEDMARLHKINLWEATIGSQDDGSQDDTQPRGIFRNEAAKYVNHDHGLTCRDFQSSDTSVTPADEEGEELFTAAPVDPRISDQSEECSIHVDGDALEMNFEEQMAIPGAFDDIMRSTFALENSLATVESFDALSLFDDVPEPSQEEPSGHQMERVPETSNSEDKIKSTKARKPTARKSVRRKNVASRSKAPKKAATPRNVASSSRPEKKTGGRKFTEPERLHHNSMERKRREELAKYYDVMRAVLGITDERSPKVAVLQKAILVCEKLRKKETDLLCECEKIRSANVSLELRLRALELELELKFCKVRKML